MISAIIALATVAATPSIYIPASLDNNPKAQLVFSLGLCARYYDDADRRVYVSAYPPADERERGYLAAMFEGGVRRSARAVPSREDCRAMIGGAIERLNNGGI